MTWTTTPSSTFLSLPPYGGHPLTNLPDLTELQPCQCSVSVLSPRQPAPNRGTAHICHPQALGSPYPTQPLTAFLSLPEPAPLARSSQFQRTGSVRDRVRKFTSDSPVAARLQDGPRTALTSLTPTKLLGSSCIGTTPASSSNSSSRGPSDTSSHKKQRELAHSLAQLQSCPREEGPGGRGLTPRSLENRAGGPKPCSEEPSTPLPVGIGTGEPGGSMKTTTFTIEIKDGRGQASAGRVLLPTGNQRAGRLLTARVESLQPLTPSSACETSATATVQGVTHLDWHCPHSTWPQQQPLSPTRIDTGTADTPDPPQHQQWGQEHHHPCQQPWDCDPTGQCHSRHHLQPCLPW